MKQVSCAALLSVTLLMVILYLTYDSGQMWVHVSDSFFLVGILYFFPGLILLTRAYEVFQSISYLTGKMMKRQGVRSFRDYDAYRQFRELKKAEGRGGGYGIVLLIIGTFHIVVSVVITAAV